MDQEISRTQSRLPENSFREHVEAYAEDLLAEPKLSQTTADTGLYANAQSRKATGCTP